MKTAHDFKPWTALQVRDARERFAAWRQGRAWRLDRG